ncbi:hypothetical protein [Hyphobacterium sp.]|uniref:hypothetical protein n=1 Tax=Hyphobacterium sp. TaxID=2004662 RepID=UPI003BAA910B
MTFSVDKSIIEPPGVFRAVLHGSNSFEVSLENAKTLAKRFQTQPLYGVIIDYADCTLGHTMEQYRVVAEVFGKRLPKGLPFAYVYNSGQLAHVMYMTKLLNAQGLQARAFADADAALQWSVEAGTQWRARKGHAA